MTNIRLIPPDEAAEEKSAAVHAVLEKLPEWFGVEAWRTYYADNARKLTMLLATDGADAIGMLTLRKHYAGE